MTAITSEEYDELVEQILNDEFERDPEREAELDKHREAIKQ